MNPNTIDSIIKQLIASHTTISTMESCTSGLIASLITDTEGSFNSGVFVVLMTTVIYNEIITLLNLIYNPELTFVQEVGHSSITMIVCYVMQ